MLMERNTLMEWVYPKIKEYCKEKHGLEFQVVDMRWGVRDEATDDHLTTNISLEELENCKNVSVGPSFFFLIGQKYGYKYGGGPLEAYSTTGPQGTLQPGHH